jgi:chromosome segregation ATPase
MSGSTGAPAELDMLREVIRQYRTVLTEWDRFLDWVQAERRELEDLRARFSALAEEHAQLRAAYEVLREDHERAQEKLRTLRLTHEDVLQERRDTTEVLDAALRRLRP